MSKENYRKLLIKDKTSDADVERKALFLIFSNDDLFRKMPTCMTLRNTLLNRNP